jgi:hypothetical protein
MPLACVVFGHWVAVLEGNLKISTSIVNCARAEKARFWEAPPELSRSPVPGPAD